MPEARVERPEVLISIDIESAGPTPREFPMLSIGACPVDDPAQGFYIELQPDAPGADPRALAVGGLAPAELALELSAVFRRYLEAAHGWPATRRTTREILDILAGLHTATELDSSRRLLMAMDLVKFADRDERATLFERLDDDFGNVVRPVGGTRA
jgi:hypothetical protein